MATSDLEAWAARCAAPVPAPAPSGTVTVYHPSGLHYPLRQCPVPAPALAIRVLCVRRSRRSTAPLLFAFDQVFLSGLQPDQPCC
ncbi:hypothetical protein GGP41_006701 [Bipolaris sorokiniana]|uniref:Uncharacterized protein n=1 Tax=Cochliobolus sativus TaxID=45130 RepID=A0A8H6E050_COCSA|nr:hypothetical protein GGP41_006701 [Bipolaris sorokiniana]